jgi:hypothetical protein
MTAIARAWLPLVCIASATAHADPRPTGEVAAPPVAPLPTAPVSEVLPSYRWQIVVPDVVALGLAKLADQHQDASGRYAYLAWMTIATYGLGGPLVHLAHREPARAAASFGVRAALPLIALALSSDSRGDRELAAGYAAVAAMVFDVVVIAPGERVREVARPKVAPQLVARPGYLGLGLGGAF